MTKPVPIPQATPGTRFARLAMAGAALLFLAQGLHGLAVTSGTCDELGAHLPAGILYWKSGVFSGGSANPPLGQLLVAAGPVLTGGADHPLADTPGALAPARLPVLLLGLITVLVAGRLGARAGGATAGVAAAAAAALSPNLIAHAGLATLDLPAAALVTAATLAAWTHARRGGAASLVAYGLLLGAAVLVKLSALHLLPSLALGALFLEGTRTARISRAARFAGVGIVGIVAVSWLAYGPGRAIGPLPAGLVEAFATKWEHGRMGHFAYLLGERSLTGFPHYFVVALCVKTPPATLLAAAVGIVALLRRRVDGDVRGFAALVLLPAAWLFAALSLVHRVDIGVRHALPVLPALHVLAGLGVASLIARAARSDGRGRVALAASASWVLSLVATAVLTTPDHLAYFNAPSGGPSRGDRILIDSNLDWGQDEGRFRAWVEAEAAAGRPVTVLPSRPTEGRVAANVNAIRGILTTDDARFAWMDLLEPEQPVGATWRVVRADEETLRAAAERAAARGRSRLPWAEWLAGTGRADEALRVLDALPPAANSQARLRRDRARAEAALAKGDLDLAREMATRAGDPDLAARVAYRTAAADGIPWREAAGDRWIRLLPALVRNGERSEAERICRETVGLGLEDLVRGAPAAAEAGDASPANRELETARRYRAFALEREALAAAGRALVVDPSSADALWLYGELVVRRKLGLTEYPWPDVEWSGVTRAAR